MSVSVFILYTIRNTETATSEFSGLGIKALPAILIYAVFNTSLLEEILFRGFLLKRLSNKSGFSTGNIIQSILFGLMHGVMFFKLTGIFQAILIIAFTGGVAWCIGYVNEKSRRLYTVRLVYTRNCEYIFRSMFSVYVVLNNKN